MPNTSHLLLLVFYLLFPLLNAKQFCYGNVKVPQIHRTQIHLHMMNQQKGMIKSNKKALYLFKFPSEFATRNLSPNIHSILSIENLQVQKIEKGLNYRVSQQRGDKKIIIAAEAFNFQWKDLTISILLFNRQVYSGIYFGSTKMSNVGDKIKLASAEKFPPKFPENKTKALVYLNGMNIELINPKNFQYELEVVQKLDFQKMEIVIQATPGQNSLLKDVFVSFIIFEEGPNEFQISGIKATFNDIDQNVKTYFYLQEEIISRENFFIGFNSFKFTKGPGELGIKTSQSLSFNSVLELVLKQPTSTLKVSVFRIGNNIKKICSQCGDTKIAYDKQQIICDPNCQDDQNLYLDKKYEVQKCVKCQNQLNMQFNEGRCICQKGYTFSNGRCIVEVLFQQTVLNSKSSKECNSPHQLLNQFKQCVCEQGYQRKNGACQLLCVDGYYNGQICVNCPQGQYPLDSFYRCKQCGTYCQVCESVYSCKACKAGFNLDSQNQCIQICGDGIKNNHECDDGNEIPGDGCSQKCQIQEGYRCEIMDGMNKCRKQEYKIALLNQKFQANNWMIELGITPPFKRQYKQKQLQEMLRLKFFELPEYSLIVFHNQGNLQQIRIMAMFSPIPPNRNPKLILQMKFPNGDISGQMTVENKRPEFSRFIGFNQALNKPPQPRFPRLGS